MSLSLLSLILLLSACSDSDSSKDKVEASPSSGGTVTPPSNPNPGNGGNTGQPGICNAQGVNDSSPASAQIGDYFRILVAGDGNFDNTPSWVSTTVGNQNIFITDSRLRLRFVIKQAPSAGTLPNCQFKDDYLRLRLKVGIKSSVSTQTYDQVLTFQGHIDNGDYDICTTPQQFNMNQVPPSSAPYILEIYDVDWDRCNNGWNAATESPACAYNSVWDHSCFEVEMQMVTDYTYNF